MDLFVPGPAGRLQAILEEPERREALGAAIVCHPHPRFGGTLRNTIVFRIARALRAAGLATLRFNFRGVEQSEGAHDGDVGEERDAAACLDHLEAILPGAPLWAAGFSFGARTVATLSLEDGRIERLVLVALPVEVFDCGFLERLERPALALFGGADEFGTMEGMRRRHPTLPATLLADEVPGADHLFRGRTPQVEQRVRAYALRSLGSTT